MRPIEKNIAPTGIRHHLLRGADYVLSRKCWATQTGHNANTPI